MLLTQPMGIAVLLARHLAQGHQRRAHAGVVGVGQHSVQRGQHMLGNRARRAVGQNQIAGQTKTASLKAVERIHAHLVWLGRARLGLKPGGQRASIGGQLHRARQRQRRVAHADFQRAEFWLGADVPVKILHGFDHAKAAHLVKISVEFCPISHRRHKAGQRKRIDAIQPRGLKRTVHPLIKRR